MFIATSIITMLNSITPDSAIIDTAQGRFKRLPADVASRADFAAFIVDTIAARMTKPGCHPDIPEVVAIARRGAVEADREALLLLEERLERAAQDPHALASAACCRAMLARREHNRQAQVFLAFHFLCVEWNAAVQSLRGCNPWMASHCALNERASITDSPLCDKYLERAVRVAA